MKKRIFILFVLSALCCSSQASQKRKFSSDDSEQSALKKTKIDVDEIITKLNKELSRYRTQAHWHTRKQKIKDAYEAHTIDLNRVQFRDRSIVYNPLSQAVDYSDQEFVHWLLERGMSAQTLNVFQEPVICRARSIAIVQDLLAHGASVHCVNNLGEPLSLHAVMEHYDPELVQLYGAHGRATIMNTDSGATPLARLVLRATDYRTKALAQLQSKGRFLIDAGANITDPIFDGKNFDQLIESEMADLRKKAASHSPKAHEKNIKKLEALSQAVHKAVIDFQKRNQALREQLERDLPLPDGIKDLISDYGV